MSATMKKVDGYVLPVEAVPASCSYVFPKLPGSWFPGVPVASEELAAKAGISVKELDALVVASGAPLVKAKADAPEAPAEAAPDTSDKEV